MKRLVKRALSFLGIIAIVAASLIPAVSAYAMDASISFDTEGEYFNSDEDVVLNVRINCPEKIGRYYIEIAYDEKLIYLSGADKSKDGRVLLTGTGFSQDVTYSITFRANKAGEAGFVVDKALIYSSVASGAAQFDISESSYYLETINIAGIDEGVGSFSESVAAKKEIISLGRNISGAFTDESGNILYVVDLVKETVPGLVFPYELVEGSYKDKAVTYATDGNRVLNILALMDRNGNLNLYSQKEDSLYQLSDYTDTKGVHYLLCPSEGCISLPAQIESDSNMRKYAVYMIADSGESGFNLIDKNGQVESFVSVNRKINGRSETFWDLITQKDTGAVPWEKYLITAGFVCVCLIILFIIAAVISGIRRSIVRRKYRLYDEEDDFGDDYEEDNDDYYDDGSEDAEADSTLGEEICQNKAEDADLSEEAENDEEVAADERKDENMGDFEFNNSCPAFNEIEEEFPVQIEDLNLEDVQDKPETEETLTEKTIVISALPVRSKRRNYRKETEEPETINVSDDANDVNNSADQDDIEFEEIDLDK